jgi:uncharacterized DUF497 family protein
MIDVDGFEWDNGNLQKCQRHRVSVAEIEGLFFGGTITVRPDSLHSINEERFQAIGQTSSKRYVFLVFTLRLRDGLTFIRPISAPYMHVKEIGRYGKDNPDI